MHIPDISTEVKSQEMMMPKRQRFMKTRRENQTYTRKCKLKQFCRRKEINKKEKDIYGKCCLYCLKIKH